jgi:hypothetical protein
MLDAYFVLDFSSSRNSRSAWFTASSSGKDFRLFRKINGQKYQQTTSLQYLPRRVPEVPFMLMIGLNAEPALV